MHAGEGKEVIDVERVEWNVSFGRRRSTVCGGVEGGGGEEAGDVVKGFHGGYFGIGGNYALVQQYFMLGLQAVVVVRVLSIGKCGRVQAVASAVKTGEPARQQGAIESKSTAACTDGTHVHHDGTGMGELSVWVAVFYPRAESYYSSTMELFFVLLL